MNFPGLAIKAGTSALVKTVTAAKYKIDGNLFPALAAGDLPVLTPVGTIATGFTQIVLIQVDEAGTVTYKSGPALANASILKGIYNFANLDNMPVIDAGNALVGYLVIKNTSGSNFVANTTALDAAGITVTYVDAYGYVGS